ncbi:putative ribonuclease H-like domain-containing protein [Tanacetum coccineum]
MALPEDHLAKFHKMTDAKEMWDAIKSRFGGNDESKKMQKYILKQQFEGFSVSNTEGLHKGYDRFQSLLSQLEIHGAGVSTEDANQKFLRSLPSAWSQVSLIMRTKPGVDSLSFDDLYNNLRVFESDIKGSTASSSSSSQNVAFVSENTSSTNEVSTAYCVPNLSGQNSKYEQPSSYSLLANQSSCPQLDHEDLEQIDEYDLEEMDLKWQVAMISMRMKKFYKKTETVQKEDSKALVTIDGEGVDWTNHSEDEDYALMACNSSDSDTEREQLSDASIEIKAYSQGLKKVEAQLVAHQQGQLCKLLNTQMSANDKFGLGYGDHRYDGILSYENEVLQSVFMNKESEIENQPLYDRFVTAEGMHAVPPPMIGNYMPSGPDVEVDDSKFTYGPKQTQPSESESQSSEFDTCESNISAEPSELVSEPVVNESNVECQPKVWSDAPIIEEYESDSEDEHMTGNKACLAEFQDFNGGPVAFGELQHFNLFLVSQICNKKNKVLFTNSECLVLSSEFKLPDENQGNLVRGLPSKIFQNDHTCVACQKGKQHKASCKAKAVSSISQTLQLLHMDLFGPTSVRSLNHKTYCLVITDDFSRFSWVFFLRTKDETSAILKDFIRQIENQLNQKVKTIRSDNGTEFKNKDVIEFCGSKGIKREYSNARTPQQNGVAERKNRTLIEAARTMLADSFLPNTFWAEAVSTACYVLNRVLVTKPHNKTPYELLTGKIPIISYIRPFGCHVTILNTIDHLGKFAGKSDEGFLVGYSLQSKAFRVYNLETKRVEENLHINFLENKPNVAGKGPTWLFDLDYLTDSMNYHPIRSENQANQHVGQQEANQNAGIEDIIEAGDSEQEDESTQDCFVLPIWPSYSSTITPDLKTDEKRDGPREEEQVFMDELKRIKRQEKEANEEAEALRKKFEHLVIKEGAARPSSTNIFSTVSTPAKASSTNLVNTVSLPVSTASLHEGLSLSDPTNPEEDDSEIPPLEDIYQNSTDGIFTTSSYDDEGAVADFTNLETIVNVSPIPTSRIHSTHPKALILGDPTSAVQTRSKLHKSSGAHAFVSYVQKQRRNNHKDFQHCLFACFLSQQEPKKISEALEDESWVDAMQEELLQFKIQKVWVLVDLPYGKKAIGTKWVYRHKNDERGVVIRNKARLVAQGHRQHEGIDYDEVFAPVARIEAIRIFLAFASYMGFIVYQMDVKSAFLYGKLMKRIDTEEMSLMRELTFFLGLQVKQKEDDIFISQDKYVAEILKKFDFANVKTASTPIETQKPLVKDEDASDVDVHFYRFQVTPKSSHLSAVKRIFRYLKSKPKLGLWYPRVSSFDLESYSDSDYARANLDRKSTTRADLLTKAFDVSRFQFLVVTIGMVRLTGTYLQWRHLHHESQVDSEDSETCHNLCAVLLS